MKTNAMINTTATPDIDAIVATLESLDWRVRVYDNVIEIEQSSGLDEDIVETLDKADPARSMQDIAYGFDPEEHAAEWYGNRDKVAGVPQSLRELLDDADCIARLYMNTMQALYATARAAD